jgi:hypothetical protein
MRFGLSFIAVLLCDVFTESSDETDLKTNHVQHHLSVRELGHLSTCFGITHPVVSSAVFLGSFFLLGCSFLVIDVVSSVTVPSDMEENAMPVHACPEASDGSPTTGFPCCGPITHSGDISTTGKSHKKQPDRSSDDLPCFEPKLMKTDH